jgi:NAD(P)-dependent dehydrogenase (short-subunit alcohol dehydrogenase family)
MDRKIAFITGASRGIGAAAAVSLAKKGFDIVVTARTLREGEASEKGKDGRSLPGSVETTAEAVRALGREALPLRLDLLDRDSIHAAVDETLKHWGHIDLLLNNGIYQGSGTLDRVLDIQIEDLETLYQGNLFSQLILIQRILPGMLERKNGTLINMVSASGMMDPPAAAGEGGWGWGYSGSKAAFLRMVGVLHQEHKHAWLRLFNVEPGFTPTETMKARGIEGEYGYLGATPEVCSEVIAWLATEEEALELQAQTIHSQRLCKKLGLVEGWPPPRPE